MAGARQRLLSSFRLFLLSKKYKNISPVATNATQQQQQHALLRAMADAGAMRSARATAAATALRPGTLLLWGGADAVPVEALARFSLLRETAAACEADAAQRCVPLVAQLAAHCRRAAAPGGGGAAASSDPQQHQRSSPALVGCDDPSEQHIKDAEQEPPPKRLRAEGGVGGQQQQQTACTSTSSSTSSSSKRTKESLHLYAGVACVARWGEIAGFLSLAQRQEAAWAAALGRLRAQADAAAAWIEPLAAAAASGGASSSGTTGAPPS